jgi:dGTP triphosphohydrolase
MLMLELSQTLEHQIDELTEWVHNNVAVPKLLKAKREAYQSLKTKLVADLARQARESLKSVQGETSSTYRPIEAKNFGTENMSDEDKARMERKRARKMAGMDADTRRLWEEQEKKGTASLMF